MLRRLLTCLALITGLAASGAPAHAGVVEMAAERVASFEQQATGESAAHVVADTPDVAAVAEVPVAARTVSAPRVIETAPVLIGPDRALE